MVFKDSDSRTKVVQGCPAMIGLLDVIKKVKRGAPSIICYQLTQTETAPCFMCMLCVAQAALFDDAVLIEMWSRFRPATNFI